MNALRNSARQFALKSHAAVRQTRASSGKIFGEEEKAAENVFIKRQEAEKAEFLKKLQEGQSAEAAEAAAKEAGHAAAGTKSTINEGQKVAEAAGGSSSLYSVGGAALAGLGLGWFLFGGK